MFYFVLLVQAIFSNVDDRQHSLISLIWTYGTSLQLVTADSMDLDREPEESSPASQLATHPRDSRCFEPDGVTTTVCLACQQVLQLLFRGTRFSLPSSED